MQNYDIIVKRIKDLREDNDLTQKEFGSLINKSQQGYAHLENKSARFTVEDLQIICNAFDISADYFLGFIDKKQSIFAKQLKIKIENNEFTIKEGE